MSDLINVLVARFVAGYMLRPSFDRLFRKINDKLDEWHENSP